MKNFLMRLERYAINLLAAGMAVLSLQAVAAEQPAAGSDFNHMTTGFQLTGAHATAACETCHVGGVFKGTPRDCEGCHAIGQRILATPKHNAHIETDAPCESCHFNAATFLGARYNHGTAKPGDCQTCHNGRVAQSKHAGHVATNDSCDQCHRTSTWLPASWNHTGSQYSGQDCKTCHKPGGPGRDYTTVAKHNTFMVTMGLANCTSCHTNYYNFYSHYFKHDKPFVSCAECHANPIYFTANGVTQAVNTIHPSATAVGINNCESCHTRNYVSWAGARYNHSDAAFGAGDCLTCHDGTHAGIRGIPSNHIYGLANLINPPASCNFCHTTTSTWGGMNHAQVKAGTQCIACHLTGTNNFGGMSQRTYGHEGMTAGQDCATCHGHNYGTWDD